MTKKYSMSPETSAINGFNAYAPSVSGARQQMMGGNLTQNNVIVQPTRKRHRSGLESEFAKGCWYLEFDDDVTIIDIIPQYSSRVYGERFDLNPMDVVIFEKASTGQLDCISLPRYHSMHMQYGFSYVYDEEVYSSIQKGARFKKGTKVARSPGVTEDGEWMAGRQVNIAVVTHAAGIEDGIMVSESCADGLRARGIEKRSGSCGRKYYPTNMYGKNGEYKIFPDIGEVVDTNGLMFAVRAFDETLDPIYMTENRLKQTIYNVDRTTFCQPQARTDNASVLPSYARVIDVRIFHNDTVSKPRVPEFMVEQPRKYWEATRQFYLRIIKTCLGRDGIRGWDLLAGRCTERLNAMITYGIGYCGDILVKEGLWDKRLINELRLPKHFRGERSDEWRWEITFEYLSPIGVGPKVTDLSGSKGVITRVIPDEDMFVDENGVRADIVLVPSSTSNRMNIGRGHEHLISAASRDCIKDIRKALELHETEEYEYEFVRNYLDSRAKSTVVEDQFKYLLGMYEIISPTVMYPVIVEMFNNRSNDTWWLDHMAEVIIDGNEPYGMYIQNPIGCGIDYAEVVEKLSVAPYRPRITPLTYRDLGGKMRTTKTPIMIGSTYLLALEKTATDYNGVSISRVNHFGIGTRLSNNDKYLAPVREVGSNHSGESENRNMAKSTGGEVVAMLAEINNDPESSKKVGRAILTADKPSNLPQAITPSEVANRHRARNIAREQLYVAGKELIRPYTD